MTQVCQLEYSGQSATLDVFTLFVSFLIVGCPPQPTHVLRPDTWTPHMDNDIPLVTHLRRVNTGDVISLETGDTSCITELCINFCILPTSKSAIQRSAIYSQQWPGEIHEHSLHRDDECNQRLASPNSLSNPHWNHLPLHLHALGGDNGAANTRNLGSQSILATCLTHQTTTRGNYSVDRLFHLGSTPLQVSSLPLGHLPRRLDQVLQISLLCRQ
jgi:hypothetical protein